MKSILLVSAAFTPIIKADCLVSDISRIGNGICDINEDFFGDDNFNTEECGWDGGDCIISEYPDCHVDYPTSIGNGVCDVDYNGAKSYNTEECGWDGGDCIAPAGYPDCHVDNPTSWLGDGHCDEGYNTELCGFDGGDCDSFNVGALLGIIAAITLVVGLICYCVNKQPDMTGNDGDRRPDYTPEATNTVTESEEEQREERRYLILKSIIRKKVLSKSTKHGENSGNDVDEEEEEILVLPHEEPMALRLSNGSTASSGSANKGVDTSILSQIDTSGVIKEKDNVYLQASLQSLRDSMGISVRGVGEDSLYSPRCCSICCEDYRKGDGIAWSRNEECHHAYHVDCILEWLMLGNDDCPMCREQYIDYDGQF